MEREIALCEEKRELIEALRATMNHIIALTKRDMNAVLSNRRNEVEQVDKELRMAQASKDALLKKYSSHVQLHGC